MASERPSKVYTTRFPFKKQIQKRKQETKNGIMSWQVNVQARFTRLGFQLAHRPWHRCTNMRQRLCKGQGYGSVCKCNHSATCSGNQRKHSLHNYTYLS